MKKSISKSTAGEADMDLKDQVLEMSYPDLLRRKEEVRQRLQQITIDPIKARKPSSSTGSKSNSSRQSKRSATAETLDIGNQVPMIEKTSDVHWDFLMKEMMWLATDFQVERKRQISHAKKIAAGIRQYWKTKESRRLRELTEAEVKRRRLAAKIGRDVRGWWNKIERVIAYKQKCNADEERRQAMNKQLVTLVKQTEKYTESLMNLAVNDEETESDENDESNSDSSNMNNDNTQSESDSNHKRKSKQKKRRRRKHHSSMTIEEALALGERTRRSKMKVVDYNRLQLGKSDDQLYGESTASDSGSDASYSLGDSDEWTDDETTLQEAENLEIQERLAAQGTPDELIAAPFTADPRELAILKEEIDLPLDEVLERYKVENESKQNSTEESQQQVESEKADQRGNDNIIADEQSDEQGNTNETRNAKGKVTFAPSTTTSKINGTMHPPAGDSSAIRYDADDDGDASDVEDFVERHSSIDEDGDESDEFEILQEELDDETTIAQEESLPQEMTAMEEIVLLKADNEISVEELRKRYAGAFPEAFHATPTEEDVENNNNENNSEDSLDETSDFEGDLNEVDDETTMAQEESLPQEMSAEDEIRLLKAENEMSVESLRAKYAGAFHNDVADNSADSYDAARESNQMQSNNEAETTKSLGQALKEGDSDSGGAEEEFVPTGDDVDDESTMEAEERMGRDMSYEQELKMLQDENEIPVEQLRALYARALNGNVNSDVEESEAAPSDNVVEVEPSRKRQRMEQQSLAEALQVGDVEDEEDFVPQAESVDDETTIEAEEKLGRDMSYADEIALLNKDNEMSVEELRSMYADIAERGGASEHVDSDSNQKSQSAAAFLAKASSYEEGSDAEDDAAFIADPNEMDDESTLEAEERLGQEMSPEDEIAMLQKESETPIESLYEMYQKMEENHTQTVGSDTTDEDGNSMPSNDGRKRKRFDYDKNGSSKRNKQGGEEDEGLVAIQALEQSAEKARQTLASRPFLLASWVKLRKYQQTGLNWLVSLQSRRLNGILADEMGLGKTLQTISLLAYLAAYKGVWGPHLVIVPTSVIVNWETELKRFCPGLKALCYYGSAKRRKELRVGWTKTNWYHVVVTSYQLAVQDAFAFKRKRWYYLILDEAQNIKNFQSQRWQTLVNFNTQRRLLLTGTPLQNNLMELWSLLHFLMPYIFRSRKEFSFWFSNPMNNVIEGTANQNEEMIARLHGIIRPFVLRRLKKDVETQLPGKFEHIVKCPLSRRQMFFYEEFMARSSTRQALKKGGNYMGMMNVLMQLRKVCNHPDLFEPRSVVTPFVLERLTIRVPDQIVEIEESDDAFSGLSLHLISPLWSGSTSVASIANACDHDEIRSMALLELEDQMLNEELTDCASDSNDPELDLPPALSVLLKELKETSKHQRDAKVAFQRGINARRCKAPPFPFSSSCIKALRVTWHPICQQHAHSLSTPSHLLAMRRSQEDRAAEVDEMVKNFVFCVPKAGAPPAKLDARKADNHVKKLQDILLEPVERYLKPFRRAHARLTSFFPDKKLVQFDAGKLQTLAELLHDLKRGGHRVLIFTQMSKMLDILEAFLNLNGHTYVRLDGATGVDRRQRLMDRFNNDTKIFAFILSTRSGGMGINLTGADTVIFYDSDWNPAMDAQAQDRAHRIGQTREVHIYRLITEHSIEENILVKAQQKRNLDIIVMDKGKFDGSSFKKKAEEEVQEFDGPQDTGDVFTKGGLRAILGVQSEYEKIIENENGKDSEAGDNLTREQMEAAMANLEDQDDVVALRGAQKEAAEELREFDESIELKADSDNEEDDDDGRTGDAKKNKGGSKNDESALEKNKEEDEMAKEFAAWQDDVGVDTAALEASLSPTETYGLHFRQEVDPFWSVFAIMEEKRRLEASEETKDELDIDEIEREKAMEERRAIDDGDLLGTRPRPEDLVRQRNLYAREKARLRANKKRRMLTGDNWELRKDAISDKPFWYNVDTGEAIWDKPTVLLELEAEELAREKLWQALPTKPLVHIMSFLCPYPDRINCSMLCHQWNLAATDISFVRHVYPVEMGAIGRDGRHMNHNHFRTIADALAIALPGDTIELGDGHYWVNAPGLSIRVPIRFVGDENNASNVVVEMSGTVSWHGKAGWIEGITFRRPKISSGEGSNEDMIQILNGGRLDMVHSVVDNSGSAGASAVAISGRGSSGRWHDVVVVGGMEQGIKLAAGGKLTLNQCIIRASRGNGISCRESEVRAIDSIFKDNGGYAATALGGAVEFNKCQFESNARGMLHQQEAGIEG